VFDGLGQVEERVVPEERHAAWLAYAYKRKDQREAAEGKAPPKVDFVEEKSSPFPDLGSIRLSVHLESII